MINEFRFYAHFLQLLHPLNYEIGYDLNVEETCDPPCDPWSTYEETCDLGSTYEETCDHDTLLAWFVQIHLIFLKTSEGGGGR